jgi:hypothetical protein
VVGTPEGTARRGQSSPDTPTAGGPGAAAPAEPYSTGPAAGDLLTEFQNALDCCGTCAGGVLARHVEAAQAEALSEAAHALGDAGLTHFWAAVGWLEQRAASIGRRGVR